MPKKIFLFAALFLICFIVFLSGCFFIVKTDSFVAWVIGDVDTDGRALLLFSPDNGETWVRQGFDALPDGVELRDVFSVDRNNVWAVGNQSLVINTTDGGNSWTAVQVAEIDPGSGLSSISICSGKIWISGEAGLIISSDDSGQTWTVFDVPEGADGFLIQGIFAISDQVIYAVGNSAVPPAGIVLRTLDGGTSWEKIELPNNYNENGWIGVKASDEDHVVIYGGKGHYAVTANGGVQWVTGGPLSTRDLNALTMLDHANYWAACDYDSIIRTNDSGISWAEQQSDGISNSFLVGISALNGNTALIVGCSAGFPPHGKILKTVNGGAKWTAVYTCGINIQKVAIAEKR